MSPAREKSKEYLGVNLADQDTNGCHFATISSTVFKEPVVLRVNLLQLRLNDPNSIVWHAS